MNLLAHLYLSGNNEHMMLGSFIADSVKGREYNDYPAGIKKGILLHRSIDEFTDKHPITHSCKMLVRKPYKKYSGIVIDIFFDHFLAANWFNYSSVPLEKFAERSYALLRSNHEILPDRVKEYLPFVMQNNWLVLYSKIEGIERVLQRMPGRTSLPNESQIGIKILRENYNLLLNYFYLFFHDAMRFVNEKYGIVFKTMEIENAHR
ncbi:MAG: DUF479 domain-containing protein [Bacteroidia bacterium]|nr:DUF479 domain-containing protein [Bacteroidia bacterium]